MPAERPPRPSARVEAVGAVVVRSDGRVLVVRRGRPPGRGDWTLPGGKIEAGELAADAVVRELEEETGLRVLVEAALEVIDVDGEGFAYAIHEHLCAPRDESAVLHPGDDVDDARWVAVPDLEALGVASRVRGVVARALEHRRARVIESPTSMRATHTCPKCKNPEVLYLPQIADRDDKDNVRPLVAHVVHYDWRDDIEVGRIQAYVCRQCGFTELYTNEAHRLPLGIPGARLMTPADPRLLSAHPPAVEATGQPKGAPKKK